MNRERCEQGIFLGNESGLIEAAPASAARMERYRDEDHFIGRERIETRSIAGEEKRCGSSEYPRIFILQVFDKRMYERHFVLKWR